MAITPFLASAPLVVKWRVEGYCSSSSPDTIDSAAKQAQCWKVHRTVVVTDGVSAITVI